MQVKIRKALSFPTFDFSKELKEIAEKIFIPELAGRIQAGVDIDNNKYPSLASNTVRQKEKKKTRFHPEAPLIDSGELFSSSGARRKPRIGALFILMKAGRRSALSCRMKVLNQRSMVDGTSSFLVRQRQWRRMPLSICLT